MSIKFEREGDKRCPVLFSDLERGEPLVFVESWEDGTAELWFKHGQNSAFNTERANHVDIKASQKVYRVSIKAHVHDR